MGKKIVIAGAGILDVLVCPVEKDVFERGSVPVETIQISTGGDALNEATVLTRISEKKDQVSLLTLLGRDRAGSTIFEHCRKEGIGTELITEDDSLETGVNIVMIQKDGSRSFFTNPRSSLRKLAVTHFPEKFPDDGGIFCLASIFVSPELGGKELTEIFERAKAQGMCVCADMTKCKNGETADDLREALSCLDYLFVNEEEAAMVTGKRIPEDMAEVLFDCGVKTVLIKCGAEGCYVKSGELAEQFGAVPGTCCVDTTGAGDSFAAGFLCALSEGKPLRECVRWANTCGALATEKVGACEGIQNRKQVLERMKQWEIVEKSEKMFYNTKEIS